MSARTATPLVDTNVVPDRNAGMGSLLWDLQHPQDPAADGSPRLDLEFAFLDVGVSRARVATALKTLLARELGMDVDYVATERPDAVPYAHVTLLGERGEEIRRHLSRMMRSKQGTRDVTDWHCVVDPDGRVSSVAYAYGHFGNEVHESYFMGRPFLCSGEKVEFSDPGLDALLAPEVRKIDAMVDAERRCERDSSQPVPSWSGYGVERSPLRAGLSAFGIALQESEVPRRIPDRQNVLFLGNVLEHYPHGEQLRALERLAANLEDGDLVIIQTDWLETPSIEVLQVKGRGAGKTRERVRWIDTRALEVQTPGRGPAAWQVLPLRPAVVRMVSGLLECLGRKVRSPAWGRASHRVLVQQLVGHVFGTYFRAMPVEETFRLAVREALRRLPSEACPEGIPAFEGDATDAQGGRLGADRSPIVTEADLLQLGFGGPRLGGAGARTRDARTARAETSP